MKGKKGSWVINDRTRIIEEVTDSKDDARACELCPPKAASLLRYVLQIQIYEANSASPPTSSSLRESLRGEMR